METDQFLKHIDQLRESGSNIFVSIADNSDNLNICVPDWCCIERGHGNVGYMSGCNFAYHAGVKQFGSFDWVAMSNTDIKFSTDFFRADCWFNGSLNKSILAPQVTNTKGYQQNPFKIKPLSYNRIRMNWVIFSNYFLAAVYSMIFRFKAALAYKKQINALEEKVIEIYAPHGSIIFFPSFFLGITRGLKYISFMYGEELYVAEIARKHNIKILYVPELKVQHNENSSTGKMDFKRVCRWRADSYAALLEYMNRQ